MPRRNVRHVRPQARRRRPDEVPTTPARSRPKPPPVETTITPHGRCHLRHGKLKFHAHEAAQALAEAQALRRSRGHEMHMEKRAYECDACKAWHLTSREEWTERS